MDTHLAARRLSVAVNSPLAKMFANGLLFNISWLVIVVSESAAVAVAQVLLHLTLHFYFLGRGFPELRLVAVIALGGYVLDQILFYTGVFTSAGQASAVPLWMHCLWPVFATTLCHAFAGFAARPLIAAVVGGVSAALSYIAGVRLTAVAFGDPLLSPLLIGLLWAVMFPALLRLGRAWVPDD